ncbi:hypothetical protein Tco_0008487 [Tanacetum coccineum]
MVAGTDPAKLYHLEAEKFLISLKREKSSFADMDYIDLVTIKRMSPKRTSTSETPAITLAAIRKLITDGITAALEAQAATMANADKSQ